MNKVIENKIIKHIPIKQCCEINEAYFNLANGQSAKYGQGKITTCIYFFIITFLIIDIFFGLFNNHFNEAIILISIIAGFLRYSAIFYNSRNSNEEQKNLYLHKEIEYPIYSVLIALYKEECVAEQLIENLNKIEWPKNKLDIIFLCEEDDKETICALEKNINIDCMKIIVIEDGQPRTKARALNIGFKYSKGEFVCIYDAEDEPHPKQLLEAYNQFLKSDEKLAVLQAPLISKNHKESIISSQFTIDYAVWFRVLLPFISNFTGFIPLGGTSNHFRAKILNEIGAWDPYNLTEDAELGVRIAKKGYLAKTINLPTYEEAPPKIEQWLKQRTRWIQGHLQTIGVHLSFSIINLKKIGFLKFIGIFFGILLGPIYIIMRFPLFAIFKIENYGINNLNLYLYIFYAFGLEIILNLVAIYRDKRYSLISYIIFMPFYWALHAVAYVRASIFIFTKPFKWEKTPHGSAARIKKEKNWIYKQQ